MMSGSSSKILYRSEDFVVINKDPDLLINSNVPTDITVETSLRSQFPQLSDSFLAHSFRFVHRLDFSTSGALCVALTKKGASKASALFRSKEVTKHYIALVHGYLACEEQVIDAPIGSNNSPGWEHTMRVCDCSEHAVSGLTCKTASTRVIVLEYGLYREKPATKVLLIPQTGRRHQLRVHCHHAGHTIVGDYTYSGRQDTGPHRMMLHALRLVLPVPEEHLDVTAEDPFLTCVDNNWKPDKVLNRYADLHVPMLHA